MKVTSIRYERLCNLGDYNHEKVSIEIQLAEGESANEAIIKLRKWCEVNSQHFENELTTIESEVAGDRIVTQERLRPLQKRRQEMERMRGEVESFGLVG